MTGVLSVCGVLAPYSAGLPAPRSLDTTCLTRRDGGSVAASCSSTPSASEATPSAGRPTVTSRSPCSTRTPRRAATSSTPRTCTRPGSPGNRGGESETIIGEWLAQRSSKDDLIIATKVGSGAADVPEGPRARAGDRRLRGVAEAARRRSHRPLLRTPRRSGHAVRGDARRVRRARAGRQGGAHRRLEHRARPPARGARRERRERVRRLQRAAAAAQPRRSRRRGRLHGRAARRRGGVRPRRRRLLGARERVPLRQVPAGLARSLEPAGGQRARELPLRSPRARPARVCDARSRGARARPSRRSRSPGRSRSRG